VYSARLYFSAVRPRPRDDVEDDIDGDSATGSRATMSTAYPDLVACTALSAVGGQTWWADLKLQKLPSLLPAPPSYPLLLPPTAGLEERPEDS